MESQDKIKSHIDEDILLLEIEEIRKQINHISKLSDEAIPEFSKAFLLEDLKQYEKYLVNKLVKLPDINNIK